MSRNSSKDLEDQVTCPVCHEIPLGGPIFQCTNGHLICQGCYHNLPKPGTRKQCPTCRGSFVFADDGKPQRSILAAGIIENLVLPCKNSEVGCPVSLKRSLLASHVEHCEYKTIACINKDLGCQQEVQAKNLGEHLKNNCLFRIVLCKNSARGCDYKSLDAYEHEESCLRQLVSCPICSDEIVMENMPSHVIIEHDAKVTSGSGHIAYECDRERFNYPIKQPKGCLIRHEDHWLLGLFSHEGCDFKASVTYLSPCYSNLDASNEFVASIVVKSDWKDKNLYKECFWSGEVHNICEERTDGAFLTYTSHFPLKIDVTFNVSTLKNHGTTAASAGQAVTDLTKRVAALEKSHGLMEKLKKMSLNAKEKKLLNERMIESRSISEKKSAVKLGANVNATKEENWYQSALQHACSVADSEAVAFLIAQGADIDRKTKHGETLLHMAHDSVCAALLMKAGASARITNEDGQTPLHHVVACGNSDQGIALARLFLDQQPGLLNLRDKNGKTALALAKEEWYISVYGSKLGDYLLSQGATE